MYVRATIHSIDATRFTLDILALNTTMKVTTLTTMANIIQPTLFTIVVITIAALAILAPNNTIVYSDIANCNHSLPTVDIVHHVDDQVTCVYPTHGALMAYIDEKTPVMTIVTQACTELFLTRESVLMNRQELWSQLERTYAIVTFHLVNNIRLQINAPSTSA
jgi:hypothetical protein